MDSNNRRTGKDATKPRALGLLGHSVFIEMMFSCEFNRYTTSVAIRLRITHIKSNFAGFCEIHCMSYVFRSKLVLLIKIDLLACFAIPKTRDYTKHENEHIVGNCSCNRNIQ